MGWKSTVVLTKEDALLRVQEAIASSDLKDEELANALEALVGDRDGYNYKIVSEEELKQINEDERKSYES